MSEEYEDDKEREDRYEDEEPRRSIRRSDQKPGKVQAVSIMTLIGGIYAIVHFLGVGGSAAASTLGICCLWPGWYYGVVVGIFGIIKGSQLLGSNARSQSPPKGVAIMMIIDIINGDVVCLVLGIIILIFCGDPEVEGYFQGSE